MESIHKLIVIVLSVALLGVMLVGIIFTATGDKNSKSKIDYDAQKVVTTTIATPIVTTTSSSDSDEASTTPVSTDEQESTASDSQDSTTTTTTASTDDDDDEIKFDIVARDVNVRAGKTAEIYIELGDKIKLSDLEFSSSNKNIATVDDKGNVKGVSAGSCKVYIKYNDESVLVNVTVGDKFGTTAITPKTMYTSSCHFREGPGVGYNSIKVFALNTKITVVGESGDWYKAESGSLTGYVSKSYVSATKYADSDDDNSSKNDNSSSSKKDDNSSSKKDNSSSSKKDDSSSSKKDNSSSSKKDDSSSSRVDNSSSSKKDDSSSSKVDNSSSSKKDDSSSTGDDSSVVNNENSNTEEE